MIGYRTTTPTGFLGSARTRRNLALGVTILLLLMSYVGLRFADLPRANFIARHYDDINWQRFLPKPKPKPIAITEQPQPTETGPEQKMPALASTARVPQRLDLESELKDFNLDLTEPTFAKPGPQKPAASGVDIKNSPAPIRQTMPSLSESDLSTILDYDLTNLATRLPAGASGRRSGNERGSDIRLGSSGDAAFGSGFGNGAIPTDGGDAGLGAPGRGNSNRGQGGQAAMKVDLKGLDDFGDNYRNFTPIYRALLEWMRRHPVDLPEVVDRFMGFQPGNLTSRVVFSVAGRRYEMFLLCVESTYEVRVVLIDGDEVTYLIDEGFKKQSNYLRLGALTRQANGEILRFGSVMREASDRRTQEFYQIFLSWWETVKAEVGG
ncbi:MAG: hypothetical protein ONB46_15690 [candidate division KSB1 bacterium]|nr:hypothetical protein [candidate division KSB1 bacterium]MDZ7366793.1 hypothetical protein [candidate division KSB1 bacterium]MDZ7405200.1 hypothetical protein [candidate division KSB1 bacterium]